MTTTTHRTAKEASAHLYEAFTHRFGPLDLSAHQPIVKAISAYADAARKHDDEARRHASEAVYIAITHQFGPLDFGAHDPLVMAISEYGDACARESAA